MNYAEEQAMEVDALRAILMDEFEGAPFFVLSSVRPIDGDEVGISLNLP